MIKYLVKRKVKNEMLENSKKIAFYTGIAAVSTVGGYISYKAIKKMRSRKEDEWSAAPGGPGKCAFTCENRSTGSKDWRDITKSVIY